MRACNSMKALEPIDSLIGGWAGRTDIADNIWKINRGADGKQYYLPLQYVVLYLYYRPDLFAKAGLKPPTNFEDFRNAAKALTKDDISGFGLRGGAGGFDHWGPFVLGGGASFEKGGMVTETALAANRWFVDLATKDKVVPASAPTDSFRQIVDAFKAGRTAMTIHHVGSSNEIVGVLGDNVSAVPVPRAPDGKGWTLFRRRIQRRLFLQQGQGSSLPVVRIPVDRREQHRAEQVHRPAADRHVGGGELDPASETLRGCEHRVAANRRLAAGFAENARLHRARLADQHAARLARANLCPTT